ncbi:MAG: hypothetical protein ABR502_07410 [Chitinophagaceae bacterium]
MRKSKVERSIVVVLFIMVLVVFSFAQRDSKKLDNLYTTIAEAGKKFFLAEKN